MKKALVGIIMGSDSDLPVMKEAKEVLDTFRVPNEITIVSAHRTTERMVDYAASAKKRGIEVIIAGAGGAAHLPGMVASLTPLPVIGVPIKTKSLDGIDSLLSIVQMPPGVPVATVAINGAKNAGILACQILGTKHSDIAKKIEKYKRDLATGVLKKAGRLERSGVKNYLKGP
jgi:5-(carboxyamino)imidazole ribonucleotide mutase